MQSSLSIEFSSSLQQMLLALASLQGSSKHPLELIETEVRFLTSKLNELGQSKLLRLSSLGRKVEFFQSESADELEVAYQFFSQTQKAVQQSQRECKKKMDTVMREKLRKEIEINSYIDEHILTIVQQNQNQDIKEQMSQSREKVNMIRRELEKLRDKSKKQEMQLRLRLEDEGRKKRMQSIKLHSERQKQLSELKRRVSKLGQSITIKLQTIQSHRKAAQRSILTQIQLLLLKLKI